MSSQLGVGVSEGEVIDGRYRVETLLGQGGMGAVFAARHVQLDERVAIKLLLPEMLCLPDVVERFAREARTAVSIKSEHVARVFDVGTLANGAPYMVMEYLEGTDLRAWIEEDQLLAVEQVTEFLLQACEALAEAHAAGIVHRDLKPENLFCVERPDGALAIKVLDFGISKIANSADGGAARQLTQAAGLMGTPLYASPEQLTSSRDVDAKSDIWSLGVVLFELLTKTVPFSSAATIMQYSLTPSEEPPSMLARRADIPQALQDVAAKCFGKTPSQRYANVAELAAALLPFAPPHTRRSVDRSFGVLGLKEEAALPVTASTQIGVTRDVTAGARAPRRLPRRLLVVLGVAITSVIGLAVLLKAGPTAGPSHLAATSEPLAATQSAPTVAAPLPIPIEVSPTAAPSTAPATPRATVRPAKALKAPAPTKANCNPPYTLDDKGRRHYKPDCF